ncbi:hypothetical protein J8J14_21500 [Roseomonas sp. SSH11]|uniref:Uncharacterized protein n=1 Tax=Pararoseomonas baculiformis TaxID=2820812 RepID=A0ABS4AJX9_9PROT|nr:hypothetical protein [Pararoseomonas baculiformis]MBP0447347.1 hypothetical protein [Pararoseomonas baculiformis]
MTHNTNAAGCGEGNSKPSGAKPGVASDESVNATPPATRAGERWRDSLLVVGAGWLHAFTPRPKGGGHEGETPPAQYDAQAGRSYVARLRRERGLSPDRVVRLAHPDLRAVALSTTRLVGMSGDGEAVGALLGVAETSSAVQDDGGSAAAVARLTVALGLASEEAWPAEPVARVRLLLAALHAAGVHCDAPARVARLAAWILALNADSDLPVPCSPEELVIYGRLAGFGAETDVAEASPRLSADERETLPDEEPVRALFREAARTLARLATARAAFASAPPTVGS